MTCGGTTNRLGVRVSKLGPDLFPVASEIPGIAGRDREKLSTDVNPTQDPSSDHGKLQPE